MSTTDQAPVPSTVEEFFASKPEGIGVGKLYADGEFHSIVWFQYSNREDAEQMVADSEGYYVLREGVRL